MHRGKAADSRGALKLVSEALATAREAGCTGMRLLRAKSRKSRLFDDLSSQHMYVTQ
jgi:hypothetical protein